MKTYNPKKYTISFNGKPITGYADGTFINVERESDSFTKYIGTDGEVSRAANADKSGKVTITLSQTSLSNDDLSAMLISDELLNLKVGALLIKDIQGNTACASKEAWISKFPAMGLAKEVGSREWVIECGNLEMFVGGVI